MLSNEEINNLLKIDESYKAPETMMQLLLDNKKRTQLFHDFLEVEHNLNYEWFQTYFESEHADRKVKKQDFTPDSVSKLGSLILGQSDKYFEATAGTGGMAIQYWRNNQDTYFELEELSDRAVPFLLFNMAIRGITGIVRHGDSLKCEFKAVYRLEREGVFSQIIEE